MNKIENKNQLSLDIVNNTNLKSFEYQRVRNPLNTVYHKDASSILNDRFTIKISHEGRSYMIYGNYSISKMKNFFDKDQFSTKISYIHIEKIMHFFNGFYIKHFLSKKEELRFQKIITNILSNIRYNSNLELK